MEIRFDLDEAAALISRQTEAWQRDGVVADALTWRDVGESWPYPLKIDRAELIDADSFGVAVSKGDQEGRLVLSRGGWADLEYWNGRSSDELVIEAPGWNDWMTLSDFERLLRRFAGMFT